MASLLEQHAVVRSLDELSTNVRSLKSIHSRKLTDLADLRQSLLQKAFAGELT